MTFHLVFITMLTEVLRCLHDESRIPKRKTGGCKHCRQTIKLPSINNVMSQITNLIKLIHHVLHLKEINNENKWNALRFLISYE